METKINSQLKQVENKTATKINQFKLKTFIYMVGVLVGLLIPDKINDFYHEFSIAAMIILPIFILFIITIKK